MKEAAISINKPLPSPIKKIGEMRCTQMQVFGDLVVIWGTKGEIRAFTKASILQGQPVGYSINTRKVKQVYLPKNHEIIILQTANGIIVRDYENRVVKDGTNWADFYIEPYTHGLYRQNERGNWFDIEGHKLESPVFLIGDVLVSLVGKKSKKSLSFKRTELLISPLIELIQIGKIVLDKQLNPIRVFGEKITGLGKKNITFSNGLAIQEVKTGFKSSTFINERTKQPFLINDEQIIRHLKTVVKNHQRYEVFKTTENEYVLSENVGTILTCDGEFVKIDFDTYVKLGQQELVKCEGKSGSHYMDLQAKTVFSLKEVSAKTIIHIDLEVLKIGGKTLRSMATTNNRFVFNETDRTIFTLNEGNICPNTVTEPSYFGEFLGIADINGAQKYFHKKTAKIIELGAEKVAIQQILTANNYKLLNALSTKGEKIVLDVRKGFDQIERAYANGQAVAEVYDYPRNVGRKMLQNASLNTLGGTEKRVIDLNSTALSIFTLPDTLSADPAGISPSMYRSNPLIALDFKKPLKIEGEVFLKGKFLPFHNTPTTVLIQQQNNQPLHLEGSGHKNQLVVEFDSKTLREKYFIGNNWMVGAKTLTENGVESTILFSFQRKSTWLPFNEISLPIMHRVVAINTPGEWTYLLFEVKGVGKTTTYMVVEKEAPHRVLVERKKGKESPKLLDKKAILPLKLPKEMNDFQKLFLDDPGYLKEI